MDERKIEVAERLVNKFVESGIDLMHQDSEYDKYTFKHEVQVGLSEQVAYLQGCML